MTALESLKDATAKALVEAIENKHVAMVKQLFKIYYEVQQIHVPIDYSCEFDYSDFFKEDRITGVTCMDSISDDILSL